MIPSRANRPGQCHPATDARVFATADPRLAADTPSVAPSPLGLRRSHHQLSVQAVLLAMLVLPLAISPATAQDASDDGAPLAAPATPDAAPSPPETAPAPDPTPTSDLTPAAAPAPSTPPAPTPAASPASGSDSSDDSDDDQQPGQPWDFDPYRVQIWLAGNDPRASAALLAEPLREFLDRDFMSLWTLQISDAPVSVAVAAARDMSTLNYESITAADPVIAVKRDHPEAPRIRFATDVGTYLKRTYSTQDRIDAVLARAEASGRAGLGGAATTFEAITGDALMLASLWEDESTEALLINRGMAKRLTEPAAKILSLPLDNLATETIEHNDKLFIVHIESRRLPWIVSVVEVDCLMRSFSVVHRVELINPAHLATAVGRAVTAVFAPVIRIEDAGARNAVGLVRAHGLITDENSPAAVRVDDFFVPMVRKNDRNGDPVAIGPLDWAFLHVKEVDGARLQLDLHAGKSGGLQGRQNKRTFRTATRVRTLADSTIVRLHAKRNPNAPLIGYEFYEKAIDSTQMTFVGRADWDGRLRIEKTDFPLRLLYVKNGGAVLAKLPVIPGQSELEVADLLGDDQRLRAEAYIRGTQKAIVDLVAVRQLFSSRIRSRLEQGQVAEAKKLLEDLRAEPNYDKIADAMERKQTQFAGNTPAERAKIAQMFSQTRNMLVKNINEQIIRELEDLVFAAEKRGPAPAAPPTTPPEPVEEVASQ